MRNSLALSLLVLFILPISSEAQTITGRLDPEYDAERGLYVYGPLYWDVEVAPEGVRSDEFSLDLYYNKVRALMLVSLLCPDSDGELDTHATTVSAEHFLSLTTGLFTGDDCRMFILGVNTRAEVLSYRMRVSELVTRSTPEREVSSFSASGWDALGMAPADVSKELDKLAAVLTRSR
ncbi:MAG: hypothetical protein OXF27_21520 [Acidobacteria bacterium]|nr:hypothetical protein [Acidobacteriota bacterium]